MDFREVKEIAFNFREQLIQNGIAIDMIILFGSYAKGKPHQDSDIDLAIISNSFKDNPYEEGIKINKIAARVNSKIQAVPFSVNKYMSKEEPSPILHEIKKTGTLLF